MASSSTAPAAVAVLTAHAEMSGSDSEMIEIEDAPVSVHDEAVEAEQSTTAFFTEAELVEVDEKPLAVKLQEMTDALAALTGGSIFEEDAELQAGARGPDVRGKLLCRAT